MNKITIGFIVSILAAVLSVSVAKGEQPNVLLIMTDQQTADAMSSAGNQFLNTPAMDKLADDGIRFTNNYVTQPLCMPFRTSLQTARYPHEVKVRNNGEEITGDIPLLGNLMVDAGYTLNYVGKWHVGTTPEKAGYDEYEKGGSDEERAELAEAFLLQDHEKPFFLTVSLVNPHDVCQLARADAVGTDLPDGPIEIAPTNLDELPPLPANFNKPENEPSVIREVQDRSASFHYPTANWSELTWRQYLWGYYRLVEKVDAEIGRVLRALEEGGHKDNTLVIFTSDHGEGVAMHHWNQKQILYDQATKTPFIINWNGKTEHSVYSDLVSNALDIPATLLDLAGVKKPESMRGISLLPLIYGKPIEKYDQVVSETMFARGGTNLGATGRMIRTERYKYIIYDNGEKREQLFDMKNDPGEMHNLVYEKKFTRVLNEHRELIEKWGKETNDIEFPYYNSGSVQAQQLAFPGAEGFGRFAQGGRGGDVYHVTNLDDDGAGSLRFGISSASGPRTIVFDVSGTIQLSGKLRISEPYLTIAGQTAPGDGIALRDHTLEIMNTHNVIIRYIRIRNGDKNKGTSSGEDTITTNDVSDIIFDHISATWGIDAIHDLRRGKNFTLQWSIYAEPLHDTIHYEGAPHGKLGSMRDITGNLSLHHNVLASSTDRHPSLGGSDINNIIDFRNNLVFNWKGGTNLGGSKTNVINNYYKPGNQTKTSEKPLRVKAKDPATPSGFLSGNYFPWSSTYNDDNFDAVDYCHFKRKYMCYNREAYELPGELVFGDDKPVTQTAAEAYDLVLKYAGASKVRDAADTNRDGMPDEWESAMGLNPDEPDDRNDDGFTNLEEYINSLAEVH